MAQAVRKGRPEGRRAHRAQPEGLPYTHRANINGADLDEKRYWDIYARTEKLGWTVYLHPVDTIGRERTTRYYLNNLLGNPYDTGVAAASLIFGGVLDAFPELEVNLPHAGGTFPWLIGRLDHGTRVLLDSDYCFDMGLTDPVASVARIEGLTEVERQLICGGTAARLLNL